MSDLVDEVLLHRPGTWRDLSDSDAPHEAVACTCRSTRLHQLGWQPRWDFSTTVARTVDWYRAVDEGASPLACCLADLKLIAEIQLMPTEVCTTSIDGVLELAPALSDHRELLLMPSVLMSRLLLGFGVIARLFS